MNEIFQQLYHELRVTSIRFGMNEAVASDFSKTMIEKIKFNHSGRTYIPKKDKEERDKKIKAMFNGKNHQLVCDCFGISMRTLYRVINNKS